MDKEKLKYMRSLPKECVKRNRNRKNLLLNKLIEEETPIPLDKQPDTLREIFPENILQSIFRILNIKDKENVKSSIRSENPEIADEEECENRPKSVGQNNPYLNFFRCGKNADIWNKRKKWHEGQYSNFLERSDAITENITVDFFEWMQSLTNYNVLQMKICEESKDIQHDNKCMTLDEVKELFEINPKSEVTTCLKTTVKELQIIPNYVALVRKFPEKNCSNSLRKILSTEKQMSLRQANSVSFSACLPKELRSCYRKQEKDVIQFLPTDECQKRLMTVENIITGTSKLLVTKKYVDFAQHLSSKKLPQFFTKHRLTKSYFSKSN